MSKKKPPAAPLPQKDLIVLAADKDTRFTVEGLLGRHQALNIRPLKYEIITHPEHDPGCLTRSDGILKLYHKTHRFALVLFDREGCGKEKTPREDLEQEVEDQLTRVGWSSRAAVLVIDPELEIWVWSDSPHVISELGWKDQDQDIRTWLIEQGFPNDQDQQKPARPKEAMEAVLKRSKKPKSSAIFRSRAEKVSLSRCADAAFLKFRTVLQGWFPLSSETSKAKGAP